MPAGAWTQERRLCLRYLLGGLRAERERERVGFGTKMGMGMGMGMGPGRRDGLVLGCLGEDTGLKWVAQEV
jgi:hypothetical protein